MFLPVSVECLHKSPAVAAQLECGSKPYCAFADWALFIRLKAFISFYKAKSEAKSGAGSAQRPEWLADSRRAALNSRPG